MRNASKRELVKQETLAHYRRMIECAEGLWFKGLRKPNPFAMFKRIGESWMGEYCPHCLRYRQNVSMSERSAKKCPLGGDDDLYVCPGGCCDGLWNRMALARTWKEWIKRAGDVEEYIRRNG